MSQDQAQYMEAKRRFMKRLHDERRERKDCINNARHGKAHKGGRCKPCWEAKLAGARRAYVPKAKR